MQDDKRTLRYYLFGSASPAGPEAKVLDYIIHRVRGGAHLAEVVEEDYVRRNVTQDQIDEILRNPEIVHAARERMEQAFESGELRPDPFAR